MMLNAEIRCSTTPPPLDIHTNLPRSEAIAPDAAISPRPDWQPTFLRAGLDSEYLHPLLACFPCRVEVLQSCRLAPRLKARHRAMGIVASWVA